MTDRKLSASEKVCAKYARITGVSLLGLSDTLAILRGEDMREEVDAWLAERDAPESSSPIPSDVVGEFFDSRALDYKATPGTPTSLDKDVVVVTEGDYLNIHFGLTPGYILTDEDHLAMEGKD